MIRIQSPNHWHCSLNGTHDGCAVWFRFVAQQAEAHEGKWVLLAYDPHKEAFFYIGGD
jgi:hypothetical protein